MVEIGYYNNLKIKSFSQHGAILDGEDLGDILLPNKFVSPQFKEGDDVEVFVYYDSEDRIIATTQECKAHANQFVILECKQNTKVGAFMDWGLDKDLLVPYREQANQMIEGKKYCVYVYVDEISNRLVASTKLHKFMDNREPQYYEGEKVEIFVAEKVDLGYKVIVDNAHFGMIYNRELFRKVALGDTTYAFVKKVRDDNKIDVMLEKSSVKVVDSIEEVILNKIKENNGFLPVTDKSSPELIDNMFGVSKKIYKKAVGALYKQRLITIEENGLKIVAKKH